MAGWGEPASGKLFQQTQDIEPMLVQYWADGVDGGLTLNQHWFNVSCFLGIFCRAKPKGSILLLQK